MGFLSKVESLARISNIAIDIANKVDAKSLVGNLNLGSIDPKNAMSSLGSISNKIEGSMNSKMSEITNQLSGSIDASQFENIANSVDMNDFGIDPMAGLEGINFM